MGTLFKLLPLIAIGFFCYRSPETIRRVTKSIRHGPNAVFTSMDMGACRNAIAFGYLNNDRWPDDVSAFLRENINGKPTPDLDHWGNPYQLIDTETDAPKLISCGPDRTCETADDLVVPIFRKRKPADETPVGAGEVTP